MRFSIRTAFVALTAVAALGLSGCSEDSGEESTDDSTAAGENGEQTDGAENADVFDVAVGDCISNFSEGEEVSQVAVTACEEEHDQEVFAIVEVPDGEYPGAAAFETQAQTDCVGAFTEFVGLDFNESALDVKWLEPTQESWEGGDRELVCTVHDPAGPVVGTLEGANR